MSDQDERGRRAARRSMAKREESLELFGIVRRELLDTLDQDPPDVAKIRQNIQSMKYYYSVIENESGFLISLENDHAEKRNALTWLTEVGNDCNAVIRDAKSLLLKGQMRRSMGGDRKLSALDPNLSGDANRTPRADKKTLVVDSTLQRIGTPISHGISLDGTRSRPTPKPQSKQLSGENARSMENFTLPRSPAAPLCFDQNCNLVSNRSQSGRAPPNIKSSPLTNELKNPNHRLDTPTVADRRDPRMQVPGPTPKGPPSSSRTLKKRLRSFNRKYMLALSVADTSSADDRAVIKADLSELLHEIENLACSDESEEESVDEVTVKYGEVIRLFTAAGSIANPPSENQRPDKSCKIKCMACPKFDNTVRGYFRFKRKFSLLIESNMSQEMALLRLKEESVDEKSTAFHLISGKKTLKDAWAALDGMYANPRVVREVILNEAQNLKAINDVNDHQGLREIATFVTSALEDLESVGMKSAIEQSAIGTLMSKIPSDLRNQIDHKTLKHNLDSESQIKIFIEYCDRAANVAHYSALRSEATSSSGKGRGMKGLPGSGAPGTMLSGAGTQPDPGTTHQGRPSGHVCLFHPDVKFGHPTLKCRKLLSISASDAKRTLEQAGACLRCMKSHKKDACESKHFCPEPSCPDPQGHHRLIHSACSQSKPPTNPVTGSQDIGSLNAFSLVKQPKSALQEDQWNTQLGLNTIRPGHTAYVKSKGGQFVQINIFYDCGADLCQVTRSAIGKTTVKSVNTLPNLVMGVAGRESAEDWGPADLVILPLYDESRRCVAELKCIVVNYIGAMKQGDVNEVSVSFGEKGFDLSDLRSPGEGEIDVLVGCNYANLLPIPIHTIGTVILGKTCFGKVIYGSHTSFPSQSYQRRFPIVNYLTTANLAECPVPDSVRTDSRTPRRDTEIDLFDRLASTENNCAKCERSRIKAEEQKRDALYRECLEYDSEKQVFFTKMPWIKNYQQLPDNSSYARKRLSSLTKSFRNDEAMRKWYVSEFQKVIEKGVLVPVTPEEDRAWHEEGGNCWYMAHFPVLNEASASTPLRVVFDPNCRGIDIDQYWEAPPNLIPNLPGLILRFRERPIPIALDISKAYWSVLLEKPESHLHRVYWNGLDENAPIKVYRMLRNSWGLKPSGSLCSLAMHLISEMYKNQYPEVHDFVHNSMYVDDGCYSVESIEEALKLAKDTSFVLAKGGFVLKHFIIGGSTVDLSTFGPDLPAEVRVGGQSETILGHVWGAKDDTLGFKCRVNLNKKVRGARSGPDLTEVEFDAKFPSKFSLRMYVSQIMSHFDPTGLTSAVTIRMKCEMGLLMQTVKGWNDQVPDNEIVANGTNYSRCKELIRLFYELRKIVFPRCLRPPGLSSTDSPLLVIFSDASQLAYAAAAYYVWECAGSNETRLITAKAKPNPKKPPLLTIPRAECMGTILAVRLAAMICDNTTYTIKRRLFILDSTIVLSQIDSPPHKFKTWVAARLDEIHEAAVSDEFYHIESALNVADDASRGLMPQSIGPQSRWQIGEEFMKKPVEEWPIKAIKEATQKSDVHDQMEFRRNDPRMEVRTPRGLQALLMSCDQKTLSPIERDLVDYLFTLELPGIKHGETFQRAKCRVARILHFLENCATLLQSRSSKFRMTLRRAPKKLPANFSQLTRWQQATVIYEFDRFCPSQRQLEMASYYWIFKAQLDIPNSTLVSISCRSINPNKDPDGVWRAYGRTAEVKRPLTIIPKGELAIAILRQYHVLNHCGAQATLALAREEYWVIKGQVLANALVSSCVRCRKLRKKAVEVTMAPLREELTNRSQVFSVVIIDLCGPYSTLADRRNTRAVPVQAGKVWVLVVVCAASRAVHLELVEGYDTENFLAAYDSFTSVRGQPTRVIADRGSQIIGASNTLAALWQHVDQAKVQRHTCAQTTWEFVPTAAHSFIGVAERAVQSFKRSMEAVYHTRSPTFTKITLSRALNACANIMNSRPIGIRRSKASKLDDDRLVRPNDLLLGRASASIAPIVSFQDLVSPQVDKRTYDKLIRQKESFLNEFWVKFQKVSFESLFPREKWLKSGRPIEKGDIVLMRDSNPIRGHWTWGEVEDTHPSTRDGAIRKATVRYKLANDEKGISSLAGSNSKYVLRAVRDLCVILFANERDSGPPNPALIPPRECRDNTDSLSV